MKDTRIGKLDGKSDEGIFLGYSTKSKAYKCLNSNTNKIVESENVRVDEFVEKNEAECKKELKDYNFFFVYVYEGKPSTMPKYEILVEVIQIEDIVESKQSSVIEQQ